MYASDHPEVGRHIRFRDYLRQHPEQASAYEALKRELAARFGSDNRAYSDAKSEFCARIDRLALDAKGKASGTCRSPRPAVHPPPMMASIEIPAGAPPDNGRGRRDLPPPSIRRTTSRERS
jgi:hypothetical protein